jgi:citrate lyase subunit beta/citryl-CoA lyase
MILRSLLFVPGHNAAYLRKAAGSDADAVIVDLEDSVAGRKNKILARQISRELIDEGIFARQRVFVRLNALDSGLLEEDVRAFTCKGVAGFVYPKSYIADDVRRLEEKLAVEEEKSGFERGTFAIIPLIETCSAVWHAEEICRATERVVAIAFGCEDFVADLRGVHDEQDLVLSAPRAMIAMAARAAGVIPIDTVHVKVHDLADLEKNLRLSAILGFEGMLVLHPKELDLVHRYYTPSEAEYDGAKQDLELIAATAETGRGVAVREGRFLGPPLQLAAEHIIRRYEAIRAWEQSRR